MKYRDISDVRMKDRPGQEMIFRNFSGAESKYNPAGRRSVTLILDPKLAKAMKDDGWNVREKEDRDGEMQYRLQVFINYTNPRKLPRIKMVRSSDGKGIDINESNVHILDSAEIEKFDIRINPYQWELSSGNSGIKAFVKSMNVVIEHDDIADRYSDAGPTVEEEEELPFI